MCIINLEKQGLPQINFLPCSLFKGYSDSQFYYCFKKRFVLFGRFDVLFLVILAMVIIISSFTFIIIIAGQIIQKFNLREFPNKFHYCLINTNFITR